MPTMPPSGTLVFLSASFLSNGTILQEFENITGDIPMGLFFDSEVKVRALNRRAIIATITLSFIYMLYFSVS